MLSQHVQGHPLYACCHNMYRDTLCMHAVTTCTGTPSICMLSQHVQGHPLYACNVCTSPTGKKYWQTVCTCWHSAQRTACQSEDAGLLQCDTVSSETATVMTSQCMNIRCRSQQCVSQISVSASYLRLIHSLTPWSRVLLEKLTSCRS
jgi:hypothetical protein